MEKLSGIFRDLSVLRGETPATGKCDVDVATAVMKGSYSWKASHRFRVCKAWGGGKPARGHPGGHVLAFFYQVGEQT